MDRKMDSGCLEPGETMEDEYEFGQTLLPEEIIGIIDQLLCHEVRTFIVGLKRGAYWPLQMAWHIGHPLAQTIFTSLYIDRLLSPHPQSIQETYFDKRRNSVTDEPITLRVLRAYCLGLIKTCFYVDNRVKAEHFYEVRINKLYGSQCSAHTLTRKKILSHTLSTEVYSTASNMMISSSSLKIQRNC